MKWTVSSLYLLVFISLLGFGLVLDEIYSRNFPATEQEHSSYQRIFESVRDRLNLDIKTSLAPSESSFTQLPDLFVVESVDAFPLPAELAHRLNQGQIIMLDSESGISLHQRLENGSRILSFGPLPATRPDNSLVEYGLTIIFYLGVALVLVMWVRPLIRDVGFLSVLAKRLERGELDARLPNDTWFLKELFNDYNRMASRLQELSQDNQLFNQAVSHDLRTPLARIEFALEKLDSENDREKQQSITNRIRQDLTQIGSLSAELLDYSRIGQNRKLQTEKIDLHVFMHQSIAEFPADKLTIAYQRESDDSLPCSVDVKMFQKLIRNLIGNAVKFARDKVLISITEEAGQICIRIEDDGEGIDNTLLPRIFEPFVKSTQDKGGNFGLGLAICERVVSLHQGEIIADNHSGLGGARFIVKLKAGS